MEEKEEVGQLLEALTIKCCDASSGGNSLKQELTVKSMTVKVI